MENRIAFLFYIEWLEDIKDLPAEETKLLIDRIHEYLIGNDEKSENLIVEQAFKPIKRMLNKDFEKYQKAVAQRSEAGKKSAEARERKNQNQRNSTNVNERQRNSTNSTVYEHEHEHEHEHDDVREKKKEKKIQKKKTENCPSEAQQEGQSKFERGEGEPSLSQKKIFVIPTIEQIEAYCKERKNNVDASQFFDFYESKNWMIGKNKMRDWKASVRTWERRKEKKPDLKPLSNDQKQMLEYYKSKIKMNPNSHVPEFFKQYLSQ